MKRKLTVGIISALAVSVLLMSCGKQPAGGPPPETLVNTFVATTSDTPITAEYSGTIMPLQSVSVKARINGYIVEKYVTGGTYVEAGQPLFRIDSRQYESGLAAARANTAQAKANYENAMRDLERYRMLLEQGAISEQQFSRQQAMTEQYRAVVAAGEAQAEMAADNVADTVVRAPFSGVLGVDDLAEGTMVTAGVTPLVTLTSSAPVYVQFRLSETEYLQMSAQADDGAWGENLKLRLADGSLYGETGEVKVVEQNATGGGQFVVRAVFANADGRLRPGMYANIVSDGRIARGSILIPRKALQPMLDKEMVMVVDADNKVSQKVVHTGGVVGDYIVVTDGLRAGETVVVEGQAKIRSGQTVKAHMLTKEDIAGASTGAPAAVGK